MILSECLIDHELNGQGKELDYPLNHYAANVDALEFIWVWGAGLVVCLKLFGGGLNDDFSGFRDANP